MSLNVKVGKYSIHSAESIEFMEKLDPDPLVLAIMKNGLKFDFSQDPPSYFEANNKSCLQHLSIAQAKVEKWQAKGYCYEVSKRPHCCSPLSVASKIDYLTGETKLRPCLDLSRHVNKFLEAPSLKLEDLEVNEKLLDLGCYQVASDLESCYLHVNVAQEFQKYLGFALPDKSGNNRFYQFAVMIFGMSPAVFIVTSLTKPLIAHLHKRGIRATIYIE